MAFEDPAHDPLFALRAAISERDWDRIQADEGAAGTYITTRRDEAVRDRIDELLRRAITRKNGNADLSRENRLKGRAEIIVGGSGAGKTRTIEKAVLAHAALRPTDGVDPTRPLLSINAPENASPRALYMRLLNGTRYPLISAPSTEVVLHRFKAQARKLGVVLIHIDDAANMTVGQDSFRRRRAAERIAACLRGFMEDDNPISLVISGLEPVLDLLRYDEAFARRASVLNFDPIQEAEMASLAKAIRSRAVEAGLQFEPARELIERLAHAANRQLGLALEMSWQAISSAVDRRTSALTENRLDAENFAEVYYRRTGCTLGLNVFQAADWRRIDTSETIPRLFDSTSASPSRLRRKT